MMRWCMRIEKSLQGTLSWRKGGSWMESRDGSLCFYKSFLPYFVHLCSEELDLSLVFTNVNVRILREKIFERRIGKGRDSWKGKGWDLQEVEKVEVWTLMKIAKLVRQCASPWLGQIWFKQAAAGGERTHVSSVDIINIKKSSLQHPKMW